MSPANTKSEKVKLVISSGEPAGIGPDICLSLSKQGLSDRGLINQGLSAFDNTELYIVADPELLEQRAGQLNTHISLQIHHHTEKLSDFYQPEKLNIIPLTLTSPCRSGVLNPDNSRYVLDMLDLCHQLCMKKNVDAMVTGPVQKSIINQAGFNFTGHTEYLADKTDDTPVMMLATKTMRVALATTHLPVKDISAAITRASLTKSIEILNRFLKQQAGIDEPHILVCGLNPHAGEDGNLGDEEINTIAPVIKELQQKGLNLTGPLPADTLFTPKYLKNADAVLAMYHDQGLPVLKYSGFGKAVNITLGLPFVRTSVDHGTALDLAGTGGASNSSMIEAIKAAIEYCGQ